MVHDVNGLTRGAVILASVDLRSFGIRPKPVCNLGTGRVSFRTEAQHPFQRHWIWLAPVQKTAISTEFKAKTAISEWGTN